MKKSKLILGLVASSLFLNSCIFKNKMDDNDDTDPKPKESAVSKLLTGGLGDADGKTWILLTAPGSTGLGPYKEKELDGSYWNWPDGLYADFWTNGAVQNEYTFISKGNQYIPKNQNVSVHWAFANKYFGTNQVTYDHIALYDAKHAKAPYVLKDEKVGITGYTLEITNGSYVGYFDGRYKYEIAKISADTLILRHKYSDDADTDPALDELSMYATYVVKK